MSKRRGRRHHKPPTWDRLVAQAERDLTQNRESIEASKRGTPGSKPTDWRLGRGPGSGDSERIR